MEPPTTTTPLAPAAVPDPAVAGSREGNKGLLLIAIFELVKTVLFLVAAAGLFHLVNRDTSIELRKLLHAFRISGDSLFIKDLLLKANVITNPGKRIIGDVLVLYAALHATEGIGLLLRKRWAEYFTVIMTAIPIPYELYLLIHHTAQSPVKPLMPEDQQVPALFNPHVFVLKILVLIANLGIVGYLIYHLRRHRPYPLAERPDAA